MGRQAVLRPSGLQGLALWAGSDHYSLWQAIKAGEFRLPLDRVSRVYRIDFPSLPGLRPACRHLIAFRSETRECLAVVDSLPDELGSAPLPLSPIAAARLFLRLIWSEPAAVLSLLLIPLPIFLVMILFLLWVNLVVQNPDVLALFANQSCDPACVNKVLKVHSMVVALFLMPMVLVALPIILMIFQAPRYRAAINYRFAQSYCAVTLAVGIYLLAQMMVYFPFKNYGKFVMSGFGPRAGQLLKAAGNGSRGK